MLSLLCMSGCISCRVSSPAAAPGSGAAPAVAPALPFSAAESLSLPAAAVLHPMHTPEAVTEEGLNDMAMVDATMHAGNT